MSRLWITWYLTNSLTICYWVGLVIFYVILVLMSLMMTYLHLSISYSSVYLKWTSIWGRMKVRSLGMVLGDLEISPDRIRRISWLQKESFLKRA